MLHVIVPLCNIVDFTYYLTDENIHYKNPLVKREENVMLSFPWILPKRNTGGIRNIGHTELAVVSRGRLKIARHDTGNRGRI